ncbi:unnamed protein product [Hymenolepis diminuta]|uniref:Uncharacterized protein n=1 Tax=Hymenolepis diminuta TaxID=6216 RepID=A0A0R3SZ10_HYMDI|nr:unnamed protein product [Hymenolepis diminuta]
MLVTSRNSTPILLVVSTCRRQTNDFGCPIEPYFIHYSYIHSQIPLSFYSSVAMTIGRGEKK